MPFDWRLNCYVKKDDFWGFAINQINRRRRRIRANILVSTKKLFGLHAEHLSKKEINPKTIPEKLDFWNRRHHPNFQLSTKLHLQTKAPKLNNFLQKIKNLLSIAIWTTVHCLSTYSFYFFHFFKLILCDNKTLRGILQAITVSIHLSDGSNNYKCQWQKCQIANRKKNFKLNFKLRPSWTHDI